MFLIDRLLPVTTFRLFGEVDRRRAAGVALVVLALGLALSWPVAQLLPSGLQIRASHGEGEVFFASERAVLAWPQNCVGVRWQVSQIDGVFLNGQATVGEGGAEHCYDRLQGAPELRVVFRDGTSQTFRLDVLVVYRDVFTSLWLTALIAAVSALELLAPRRLRGLQALSARVRPFSGYLLLAVALAALTVGLLARVYIALGTSNGLNLDETYYSNIGATGAHGLGLYPHLQNFRPMHLMGGFGLANTLFVLAYQLFGPTIYGMRIITLIAAFSVVAAIFVVMRLWYGSATALVAVALVPFLRLFTISNHARVDSIAMAIVAWGVVALAYALQRRELRWHLVSGLLFGAALQGHLNTLAVTFAVGLLYLLGYLATAWRNRRWFMPRSPLALFLLGFAVGCIVYLVVNVLPDPAGYSSTTTSVRVTRALTQSDYRANSILDTFISPEFLLEKEERRYTRLLQTLPSADVVLVIMGFAALWFRRRARDLRVAILFFGTIIGSAFIYFKIDAFYASHLFPALVLPLAPLITHGFAPRGRVSWRDASALTLVMFLLAAALIIGPQRNVLALVLDPPQLLPPSPLESAPVVVQRVLAITTPECELAGDRDLYTRYFLSYPRFRSTRPAEINMGIRYGERESQLELWHWLQPDVIFGELNDTLQVFVVEANYREIEPDIWLKTGAPLSPGCVITPGASPNRQT